MIINFREYNAGSAILKGSLRIYMLIRCIDATYYETTTIFSMLYCPSYPCYSLLGPCFPIDSR